MRLRTLRALIDASPLAMAVLDPDLTVRVWNPSAERMFGWTEHEVLGRRYPLVPEDKQEEFRRRYAMIQRGEAFSGFETRRQRKDGSLIEVTIAVAPLRDATGGITGIVVLFADITERKRAEEILVRRARDAALRADVGVALAEPNAPLARMLQRCAEAMAQHLEGAFARIWLLDERAGVLELRASAGVYTHLDGPHGRIPVGQFKIGRIAAERRPHLTNTVIGDPHIHDQEWATREGMVAFAGYPLVVEDRLVGVMAMFARQALAEDTLDALASVGDVIAQGIERKRAEEALREARDALDRRVAERTADLVAATASLRTQIAERQRAEEQANKTARQLAEAQRIAHLGSWEWDVKTDTVTWSDELYRIYGVRPQEFGASYQAFLDRVHPDDRERVDRIVRQAFRDRIPMTFQHRIIRPDGTERTLMARGEVSLDEAGNPTRMVGTGQDVTERLILEGKFQRLLEAAPDAIVGVDRDGHILVVNAQAETLFGYDRNELLGQPVETLLPESMRPVHVAHRARYMTEPRTRPMGAGLELYARRKDGSEFPAEISLSPLKTEDGLLVTSIIRDITDRKEAEVEHAKLLAEQAGRAQAEVAAERLRRLQAVTDAALARVDLQELPKELLGRIRIALDADTATIMLLDETGGHLVALASDGLEEEEEEHVRIPLGRGVIGTVAARQEPLIVEDVSQADVVRPFLRQRVKSLLGVPLLLEHRLLGVLHVGTVQRRRFSEEDASLLRLVADRLALVVEQTRLHQAERRARAEAEAANQAKDEFLATLSHELRNPLNAIVMWTQVLQGGKGDQATHRQALENIERSAKLQARLIGDLLDVSRVITGKLRLDIQSVDLVAVIGAAIDVVRPAADAKGIRLETALDPSAGPASGDPVRLQQVLWNLLSNAVKFTSKGGRVEVRLQRVDSQVEITVGDTGEGVGAAFLPHVFDRFRQADRASVRAHGGLGLGLAIVRHLVELHGGTVRADSPGEGQGATFTLRLPLPAVRVPGTGIEGVQLAPGRSLPPEALPLLDGVRVLAVDDEADARELLRTVLEECGAVVTAAGSAAEALAVLERERPDVLISDIAMPGEDGYTLIRTVRALPPERGGRIPAVALTAHACAEDRTRALLAGFHLHVPKPAEAPELVAVIASLLGRTRGRGAGSP